MSLRKCLWLYVWGVCGISAIFGRKQPAIDSNETSDEAIREALIRRQIPSTSMPLARPINVVTSIHLQQMFLNTDSQPVPRLQISFYHREHWNDVRYEFLRLTAFPRRSVTFSNAELLIWHPDTFFPNGLENSPVERPAGHSFVRVFADGEVQSSVKQLRSFPCLINWDRYPYDSQQCEFAMESYGYSASNIAYSLRNNAVSMEEKAFYHPEYELKGSVTAHPITTIFTSGNYSQIIFEVNLQRKHRHFGELFVAPMILVILSLFALKLTGQLTTVAIIIGFLLALFLLLMVVVFDSLFPARYSMVVTRYWVLCGFQLFLELILVFVASKTTPVERAEGEGSNRVRDSLLHRTKLYIVGPSNQTTRLMTFIFFTSFIFLLFWLILFWICVAPAYSM